MTDDRPTKSPTPLPERPDLTAAFETPTFDEWKAQASAFLKGAPFEKKLVASTPEEIPIQPLYTAADVADIPLAGSLPGRAPYLRGTRPEGYKAAAWESAQELTEGAPASYNRVLRNNLAKGQDAAFILLDKAGTTGRDADEAAPGEVGACGVSICDAEDFRILLDGIDLAATPVHVPAGASPFAVAALFTAHCRAAGVDLGTARGSVTGDPLAALLVDGRLPAPLADFYDDLSGWTKWASVKAPRLQTIGVNGGIWHEAGGSAREELGYAIAAGAEYIRAMLERGIGIDTVAPRIRFQFALGPQFFMEIAKLRAARVLWAKVVAAFGGGAESQKIRLHARTGLRNKTVYDPHVNLLRGTTEALSGVLGGCDSMHVGPFDEVVHSPTRFSHRIARNIHTLLAEEFNFCETVDPAGGSWYVEKLTDQLGRAAWSLFQQVEGAGGLAAAVAGGAPQQVVAEKAAAARKQVDHRRTALLGSNLYPNLGEKKLAGEPPDYAAIAAARAAEIAARRTPGDSRQLAAEFSEMRAWSDRFQAAAEAAADGTTLSQLFRAAHPSGRAPVEVPALRFRRAAEDFERLRRRAAAHDGPVEVFLARVGTVAEHKARADFSAGLFAAGGFRAPDHGGFASAEDAAAAFLGGTARIAVLCSTDDRYPELVPAFAAAVKSHDPQRVLVLAGHPGDNEAAYREAGFDDFIHLRSDVRGALAHFQDLALGAQD